MRISYSILDLEVGLHVCACLSPSILLNHEVAVHVVHAVVGRVGLNEIDVVAPEPLNNGLLILAVGPDWWNKYFTFLLEHAGKMQVI